jgi:hypothetical protein
MARLAHLPRPPQGTPCPSVTAPCSPSRAPRLPGNHPRPCPDRSLPRALYPRRLHRGGRSGQPIHRRHRAPQCGHLRPGSRNRPIRRPAFGPAATVLGALKALSAAWAPGAYDAVIYARDHFAQSSGGDDRYRSKVLGLQTAVGGCVRQACTATGVRILDLPVGLDTPARVRWVDGEVRRLGLVQG